MKCPQTSRGSFSPKFINKPPMPHPPTHLPGRTVLQVTCIFTPTLLIRHSPSSMNRIVNRQRNNQRRIHHPLYPKLLLQRSSLLLRQTAPLPSRIPRNRSVKLSIQRQQPNQRKENRQHKNQQEYPFLQFIFLGALAASVQNIFPRGVDEIVFRRGEEAMLQVWHGGGVFDSASLAGSR